MAYSVKELLDAARARLKVAFEQVDTDGGDPVLAPVNVITTPAGASLPVQLSGSNAVVASATLQPRTASGGSEGSEILTVPAASLDGYSALSIALHTSVALDAALRFELQYGDAGSFGGAYKILTVDDAIGQTFRSRTIISPLGGGGGDEGAPTAKFIKCPALAFWPRNVGLRLRLVGASAAPTTGSVQVVITGYPL